MSDAWQDQQERSNRAMLSLLLWLSFAVGRTLMGVVAFFIAAYFLMTSKTARNASREYLSKVLPHPVKLRHIFKHFFTFARVSIDRLYILSGKTQAIKAQYIGREVVDPIMKSTNGALVFVAHLGSMELLRVSGNEYTNNAVSVLMDRNHNQRVMEILEKLDPELASMVIDAKQDPVELAMTLQARLQGGGLVGIMADRALPNDDHFACDFMGQPALFPLSPWRLAMVLQVPIIMCVGLYEGRGSYTVHFDVISPHFAANRREREQVIQAGLQKYVQNLESYCKQSPYNWFNFYSYWTDETLKHH